MPNTQQVLSINGELHQVVEGFQPRQEQLDMALAVEKAIADSEILVVEAGTGTGKTFAYLVPLLLSGKKALISTGTKNLQDQLFQRDLPTVVKALKGTCSIALLKGRANYLCPYRLEVHLEDGRFQSRQVVSDLQYVARWAAETVSGDISEISTVSEQSDVWPFVTSTGDNCLGQDCPVLDSCPVMKARKKALEADVVVVNHHLFFADASLKGEGVAELLPQAEAIVFDEAHQLMDVASHFFGYAISSRQLIELSRDTITETVTSAGDMSGLLDSARQLEKSVADFRLVFPLEPEKNPWSSTRRIKNFDGALAQLTDTLEGLKQQLEPASVRSKGLDNCFRRCKELLDLIKVVVKNQDDQYILWYETFKTAFAFYLTPLSVAEQFRQYIDEKPASWVFTSATLSVDKDFSHFTEHLGLEKASTLQLDSPFDYREQALFYVPRGMKDPADFEYTQQVVDVALSVLEASEGRAFLLFTSHRALQYAAGVLEDELNFPLFIQGTKGKNQLLEEFRRSGNGVLLGTGSFWEGVDVRGEALSCVIIDKLPFASPSEPVIQARIEAFKKQGRNPFFDFQLPNAIIALKQGAGRLIRDAYDRGVLVVCDPRLVAKPYGGKFVTSLPAMTRTRNRDHVSAFFKNSMGNSD